MNAALGAGLRPRRERDRRSPRKPFGTSGDLRSAKTALFRILRYGDIPQSAASVFPRPVFLLGKKAEGFAWTEEVTTYSTLGSATRLPSISLISRIQMLRNLTGLPWYCSSSGSLAAWAVY